MRNLLSIALVLIASVAFAQNFSPITPGTTRYFLNTEGYLRGMRIDSIVPSGPDMLYYPYRSLRGNYTTQTQIMLDSNGGSWFGKKIIRQPDGTWLFDNIWNDTIVIKTQAHAGDSWIFYNDSTDLYYQAELIQEGQTMVLGQSDSFKRIRITVYNAFGQVNTDPVNNKEIELSKNYGFIKALDLHTFPYHRPNQVYQTGFDYFLDFSSNQNLNANMVYSLSDFHYPTEREMFNWNVGDVYQYRQRGYVYQFHPSTYQYDSVISVTVNSTSTDYVVYRTIHYPVTNIGPLHYTTSHNTHAFTLTDNAYFQSYLGSPLLPEEYHSYYGIYYHAADQGNCSNSALYSLKHYQISGNLYYWGFFYIPLFDKHKEGLGIVDYHLMDGEPYIHDKELVYYRRGSITCGYHTNLDVKKINNGAELDIYPNPASDYLSITSPKPITGELSLVDVLGKEQIRLQLNEKTQIDTRNIPNGLYFIRLQSSDGQSYTSKLLIQH